jgi:hypothetical protein
MDPNILKQLGLNSDISPADAKVLQQLLSQMADKKGKIRMTPQERNQLLARLSNHSSQEYVQTKDVSEMNEQERKEYKEMLRKKMKDKINGMAQMRAGPSAAPKKNLNSALSNINQMMSGLNTSQPTADANGMGHDISHLLNGLDKNTDIAKLLSGIDMKELSKHATAMANNSVKPNTDSTNSTDSTNVQDNKPAEKEETLDDFVN